VKQFEVLGILRNFPNCDKKVLQEKYPEVNVERYIERLKERNTENLIGVGTKVLMRLPWRL
jgi:hypothetical protein